MIKIPAQQLLPYLPHGLKSYKEYEGNKLYTDVGINNAHSFIHGDSTAKIILHPLSDLTKRMEDEEGWWIPAQMLFYDWRKDLQITKTITNGVLTHMRLDYPDALGDYVQESYVDLNTWFKLFEMKFDIFSHIENGLAIDVNTLDENPYV